MDAGASTAALPRRVLLVQTTPVRSCRLSRGIEARDQILEQVETLLRAREAKREASGSSGGAVVHRNVHDYTLDDQRAMVSKHHTIY